MLKQADKSFVFSWDLCCFFLCQLLLPSNHYWGTNRPLCQTGRHDFSLFLSLPHTHSAHSPAASSPCEWKRKCRGDWSVKSPLSPPSLSDRSDTTADNNNNNNDSDKRCCGIIHEGWKTQPQRSSVSVKLPHSAACVFSKPSRSWVTTPNLHPPRRDFPLNGAHLVWERKAPNQRFKYQSAYSLTWLKSLQFVTSAALLQNKTTLCDTWAHTKCLLKHCVQVGDVFHIHNEEINKLCLKSLLTQTLENFWNSTFPPETAFHEEKTVFHQKHTPIISPLWKKKTQKSKTAFKWLVIALVKLQWFTCLLKKGFYVLLTGP